jgi:hypothetical protein
VKVGDNFKKKIKDRTPIVVDNMETDPDIPEQTYSNMAPSFAKGLNQTGFSSDTTHLEN